MNTDKFPFKKIFKHDGRDFSANTAATRWLKEKEFSLGAMEMKEPRAIVHTPDIYVPKWRHLDDVDKDALDGVATTSSDFRTGDITIHLSIDPEKL